MKLLSKIKKVLKKFIPTKLFLLLQNIYHYTLAFIGALVYRFPSKKLFIVGVMGTKGKTSTVEFVNKILEEAGYKTAIVGTLRFKIVNETKRNLFKMTMPGRFFMQKFLRKAVRAGATHAVIEMTSEGVKQYRHKFIYLDALIFTNLTPEHIESHGLYENYVLAKLSIAHELARSPKQKKFIVVNTDSKEADRFLATYGVEKIPYSLIDAKNIKLAQGGHALDGKTNDGASFEWLGEKIESVFPGIFNVYNMLAAAVFTHKVLGVSPKTISEALSVFSGIRGRMERVFIRTDIGDTFPSYPVIVDYAHTEDSLRKIYEALPHYQKICVLGGTGGGRDKWKRPLMGGVAVEFCKKIILTDEDPYDEDPLLIIDGIKRGTDTANKDRAKNGMPTVPCEVIMDRRRAIAVALGDAKTGDAVIITGKGTDPYIMGANGMQTPWDDAQVVREELTELLKTHGAHFTPVEKATPLKRPLR